MAENPRNLLPKKIANIFPTCIVGYDNPKFQTMNTQLIAELEKLELTPGPHQPFQTIDNHLENNPAFSEFNNWVRLCLEDYRRTFRYHCDEFKIILSWANKSDQNGAHRMHVHPNSFISGIYYVSENPSPTFFEDPRYQIRSGWLVATEHEVNNNVWPCPSETGNLVLFPSWLPHYTDAQPFEGWRWTISFNAIPAGATNKGSLTEMNLA
jgi:uncharacterized protein (TIGR02466 family)